MGKSKKKRQDFQKVKLKVGRKLQKGQNVTNTSFKTRTVQVTQQLKSGEVTEPNTRKKQNIGVSLQMSHVTRNPVFGVYSHVWRKPACSAAKAS